MFSSSFKRLCNKSTTESATAGEKPAAAAATPLSREEALAKLQAAARAEEQGAAEERAMKQKASASSAANSSSSSSQAGGKGSSPVDSHRLGPLKNAKGRVFNYAYPVFGVSLLFVGATVYYMSGMWQREEDQRVCVNCARQKEIAEEIYFGKKPKDASELAAANKLTGFSGKGLPC